MTAPQRVRNWDIKLAELRDSLLGQPFEWGETDCASLVRQAVATVLGRDSWALPSDVLFGHDWYGSMKGAIRTFEATGGLETVLREEFDAEYVSDPRLARQGDIVLGESFGEHEDLVAAGFIVDRHFISSEPDAGVTSTRFAPDANTNLTILRLPS